MKLLALTIAVTAVTSLSGQTPQPAKLTIGAGTTLCREWTGTDKTTTESGGAVTVVMGRKDPVQVSWILGYVSAMGVPAGSRISADRAEGYVVGFVSAACEKQPDRTLASVAADLVTFLQTHKAEGLPIG